MDTNLERLVERLRRAEVLGYLTEGERVELVRSAVCKSLGKGQVICF